MQWLEDKDGHAFSLNDETWSHIREFHKQHKTRRDTMGKRKSNALRISYDKTADVLYLAFGVPKAGIDEEIKPGIFVRFDSRSRRAIGMTIIDFEKRFSRPVSDSLPIDLAQFFVPA